MSAFLRQRLFVSLLTLLGATILIFVIVRILPGDLATAYLRGQTGEGDVDPVALARLREQLGLNKPLYMQYLSWIGGLLKGDAGQSVWLAGTDVMQEILYRFPITFQIAAMAAILGFLFGVPLGVLSAIRQDTWLDYISRLFSILFLAFPSFWLGLLILLFTVNVFDWMPPVGYNALLKGPQANLTQLIFPALVIASHLMAIISRMTRSTMLEVFREDYIRTARAKGLREKLVIYKHALRNALIPVITVVSLSFGTLLGGTVVMEALFSIPGLGTLFLESIRFRDYPTIQTWVLFMASGFLIINLIVDFLYVALDPRIKYE